MVISPNIEESLIARLNNIRINRQRNIKDYRFTLSVIEGLVLMFMRIELIL